MTYLAAALLALAFYAIHRCVTTYDVMKDQRDWDRPDPPPPRHDHHDIEEPRE